MIKRITVRNQIDMKFWCLVTIAIGMVTFQCIDHNLRLSCNKKKD
jgi:hypothetical protein